MSKRFAYCYQKQVDMIYNDRDSIIEYIYNEHKNLLEQIYDTQDKILLKNIINNHVEHESGGFEACINKNGDQWCDGSDSDSDCSYYKADMYTYESQNIKCMVHVSYEPVKEWKLIK